MRIIKGGIKPNNEKEKTCLSCNTIFVYTSSDVHPDPRDGNYIICPVCSAWINVS